MRVTTGLRGRPKFDSDRCDGCAACVEICPARAINVRDKKKRRIEIWFGRCIFCGKCQETCPREAITLLHKPVYPSNNKMLNEYVTLPIIRCRQCGEVITAATNLEYVLDEAKTMQKISKSTFVRLKWLCETCKRRAVAAEFAHVLQRYPS